eukprot:1191485-Prorocentrum_minimum.AAC.2
MVEAKPGCCAVRCSTRGGSGTVGTGNRLVGGGSTAVDAISPVMRDADGPENVLAEWLSAIVVRVYRLLNAAR